MSFALDVEKLTSGYGEIRTLFDIDLHVGKGEIVALLGGNGAGKTTTLLTIAGQLPSKSGSVRVDGQEIAGLAPHQVARRGVVLIADDRGLIPGLTVAENFSLVRKPIFDGREMFPELDRLYRRQAGLLSGGEQQMLGIARSLMQGPKVLLIDELSLGLAPILVTRLLGKLKEMARDLGTSVLVVEQHVEQILGCASRAYVMARGRVVLAEDTLVLRGRTDLLEASYMGRSLDVGSVASARLDVVRRSG